MPSVRCAVTGCQVNKPAHCFTVEGKQLPRVGNATSRRNADARVRRSLLRRAGAMLACARTRVSLPWLLRRTEVVQVRVRAGAVLACARARVATLAAPSHGRRTGVSVRVAASAASSREGNAGAPAYHFLYFIAQVRC